MKQKLGIAVLSMALIATGCGGVKKTDENKPVDDTKKPPVERTPTNDEGNYEVPASGEISLGNSELQGNFELSTDSSTTSAFFKVGAVFNPKGIENVSGVYRIFTNAVGSLDPDAITNAGTAVPLGDVQTPGATEASFRVGSKESPLVMDFTAVSNEANFQISASNVKDIKTTYLAKDLHIDSMAGLNADFIPDPNKDDSIYRFPTAVFVVPEGVTDPKNEADALKKTLAISRDYAKLMDLRIPLYGLKSDIAGSIPDYCYVTAKMVAKVRPKSGPSSFRLNLYFKPSENKEAITPAEDLVPFIKPQLIDVLKALPPAASEAASIKCVIAITKTGADTEKVGSDQSIPVYYLAETLYALPGGLEILP